MSREADERADDVYSIPAGTSRGELREKGSRFLAVVGPATSEADAQERLEALHAEHGDATHHCWAWRLGRPPRERSADAGEPSGTAGLPILQVLRGAELSDVLAVVVRWYGGTKLGKGGLARAYAGATREALAALPVAHRFPTVSIPLDLTYEQAGAVRRLVHSPDVEIGDEAYGERVHLELRVRASRREEIEAALASLGVG